MSSNAFSKERCQLAVICHNNRWRHLLLMQQLASALIDGSFPLWRRKFPQKVNFPLSLEEREREKKRRQISDDFLHPHLSQRRQIRYWLSRECSESAVKGFLKKRSLLFSLYNVKKVLHVQQIIDLLLRGETRFLLDLINTLGLLLERNWKSYKKIKGLRTKWKGWNEHQ